MERKYSHKRKSGSEPREYKDWQARVYKKEENKLPDSWHEIREAVLERDHYKCFRCESDNKRILTVHHIIPRREGGSENKENLITLCTQCHDVVEVAECRSIADIEATITDTAIVEKAIPESKHKSETFERPSWHRWVYGGGKNPRL